MRKWIKEHSHRQLFANTTTEAKNDVKAFVYILTGGTMPKNMKANAVIFGADGKGKSLNKIKRK